MAIKPVWGDGKDLRGFLCVQEAVPLVPVLTPEGFLEGFLNNGLEFSPKGLAEKGGGVIHFAHRGLPLPLAAAAFFT